MDQKISTPKQTSARIALGLSVLTLLSVLGLGGYFYQSQKEWQQSLIQSKQSHQALEEVLAQAKEAMVKVDTLNQQNLQEQNHVEVLKKDVAQIKSQLSVVTQDSKVLLNTLDFLASSAQERIEIAHDLPAAIFQLKAMNDKLKENNDPDFIPLKEAIAKDVETLQGLPLLKRQEIWNSLAVLPEKLMQLHFKQLEQASSQTESKEQKKQFNHAWQEGLWNTWQELKGLVKVTREDSSNISAILSLQEKEQVLRTVQLMIEQAQWAVLNAQNDIYQKSLDNVQKMVKDYFSADFHQTALIEEIKKLQQDNVGLNQANMMHTKEALTQLTQKLNFNRANNLPTQESP